MGNEPYDKKNVGCNQIAPTFYEKTKQTKWTNKRSFIAYWLRDN
jgi:hypothetical protein